MIFAQCPCCGHQLNSLSLLVVSGDSREPNPKDITICINCGEMSQWNDQLVLEEIGEEELLPFRVSEDWNKIMKAQFLIMVAIEKKAQNGEVLRPESSG